MITTTDELRNRWFRLCSEIDAFNGENASSKNKKIGDTFDLLAKLYSEKHRKYHNLENHIIPLLNLFDQVKHLCLFPLPVELCCFTHDSIYNPLSRFNEEASGMLTRSIIPNNIWEDFVYNIITFDKSDKKFHEIHYLLFHDMDYSIIGAPWPKYIHYCENIKAEFLTVFSLEEYYAGRADWIAKIQKETIFYTDYFRDNLEKQAKENLQWELDSIKFNQNKNQA